MNCLVYTGNLASRDLIRNREFKYNLRNLPKNVKEAVNEKFVKFNILITSYESAMLDSKFLKKINWETLIIDEAHRYYIQLWLAPINLLTLKG